MPARILVVDAVATNRILWKVRLGAAYHQVFTADAATAALGHLRLNRPDIVVLGIGGADLIQTIRSDPAGLDVPIILLGDQAKALPPSSLLRLGADEVLPSPVSETALLAHIRHLLKRKQTFHLTGAEPALWGLSEPPQSGLGKSPIRAILIGNPKQTAGWKAKLSACRNIDIRRCQPPDAACADHGETDIVFLHSDHATDALISAFQHAPDQATRPMVIILSKASIPLACLDQGADAVLSSDMPLDELQARMDRLVARKSRADKRNRAFHQQLSESLRDPLTGLLNRRGIKRQLASVAQKRPLSLIMADVDHFKRINDAHGHLAGDAVLITLARQFARSLRKADLCARYGGEEFLFALPDTDRASAYDLACRLCRAVGDTPVRLPDGSCVNVSLSFGIAAVRPTDASLEDHIALADKAMYRAKHAGRDTVILADA